MIIGAILASSISVGSAVNEPLGQQEVIQATEIVRSLERSESKGGVDEILAECSVELSRLIANRSDQPCRLEARPSETIRDHQSHCRSTQG